MKTLLIAPELFASEGGIARILRLYLKGLCELSEPDGEVRLVVLNDAQLDTTDVRSYSTERLSDWAMCGRSKGAFIRAVLSAAKDADRIVCGHVAQLPVAWLAQRVNPRLRYFLVAHGIEVWRPFSLPERIALRNATAVWCVSSYTRSELLRHSQLSQERAVVLSNALDPSFQIVPAPPAPTRPVILSVTRLSAAEGYKGVDHLISALAEIRRKVPDARLRVVGRGDDLPRLQQLASEQGVAEHVRFLGYLGDAALREELARCRIFALPSQREGFGLVYLEAMAFGKPCVAARSGAAPEVITPESGVLANYGDPADLARRCVTALQGAWDPVAIQSRAACFSYPQFRDSLKRHLTAP